MYNRRALLQHLPIDDGLATIMGNPVSVDVATPKIERQKSVNRMSTILGVASCIFQGLYYSMYS